ncbi:MAG: hypothetical protein HYX77_02010 [Acidobacteria bacterium]|nr:hypothetical protein [Acidobacteriota bacterium]
MINDAHCHFFSTAFFGALARQRAGTDLKVRPYNDTGPAHHDDVGADVQGRLNDLYGELHWDNPGTSEALADRSVQELGTSDVHRAAMIASVQGDESSGAAARCARSRRLRRALVPWSLRTAGCCPSACAGSLACRVDSTFDSAIRSPYRASPSRFQKCRSSFRTSGRDCCERPFDLQEDI